MQGMTECAVSTEMERLGPHSECTSDSMRQHKQGHLQMPRMSLLLTIIPSVRGSFSCPGALLFSVLQLDTMPPCWFLGLCPLDPPPASALATSSYRTFCLLI